MSTYLLIPGAGGVAWYWHRLVPLLERAIAVDLPGDDPSQGLPEYVDLVVEAAAGESDLVVVAQSLGAFTALPACARLDVRHLFLLNAMIPAPGETAGEWWDNTGSGRRAVAAARAGGYDEAFDVDTYFLHDVDPEILATGEARPEADAVFETPCDCTVWPPTTVLAASTTASSRSSSSAAWRSSGSGAMWSRCPAGTSRRSVSPRPWRTCLGRLP